MLHVHWAQESHWSYRRDINHKYFLFECKHLWCLIKFKSDSHIQVRISHNANTFDDCIDSFLFLLVCRYIIKKEKTHHSMSFGNYYWVFIMSYYRRLSYLLSNETWSPYHAMGQNCNVFKPIINIILTISLFHGCLRQLVQVRSINL